MYRNKIVALLLLVVAATGCKNTWPEEDKDAFYQSCIDEAGHWAGSPAKAKSYCTCVTEKVVAKYPNESDALEHMDSVINDSAILQCKADAMK